ncbi:MAG TPA: choice-of-anchor P family protein [Methylomirabilota bacterium]|nr:choice-of-anchor P family protein [Methylomirabilota bacterium]
MNKLLSLAILTAVLSLTLISSASSPGFGGRAAAVQVRVPATGATITLADSGPVAASGGGVGAALLAASIPSGQTAGLVSLAAGTLHSAVVGLVGTDAEASLANVSLTISGNGVTVDFLMARSTAGCGAGPAVAGSSQLANLVINGQAIAITGAPNQAVALPNGSAIINEQLPSVAGGSAQLTVNALHVTTRDALTGQPLADVVLATADTEIQCQTGSALSAQTAWAQSTEPEFGSGGGWIFTSGGKGTFGFVAGIQADGTPTGHLVYVDHGIDFSVESTSITRVTPGSDSCTSTIEGDGTSNGAPVQFRITVHDGGEPGRSDTLQIDVAGAASYTASGPLAGGNIEIDGSFAGGKVLAHGHAC